MKAAEGSLGRVFVLRLETGDRIPDVVEAFAEERAIRQAAVLLLGGVGDGSRMVVGPEADRIEEIVPITHELRGVQEIVGVGTLFPDEQGKPVLHPHAAAGREGDATVGCTRAGVDVWLVGEMILLELKGFRGERRVDPKSGFALLDLL